MKKDLQTRNINSMSRNSNIEIDKKKSAIDKNCW